MSTIIVPIGIKLEEINAVFGSKNNELFIKLTSSDVYNHYDEEYSFKRELEELIFHFVEKNKRVIKPSKFFGLIKGDDGRGLNGEWFDYAFALLVICHHLGHSFLPINKEIKIEDNWNQFQTVLSSSMPSYNIKKILSSEAIFDTPFKKDDEVKTFLLNKAELHQFKIVLDKITSDYFKNELFGLFRDTVQTCLDKEMDLIFFSIEKIDD